MSHGVHLQITKMDALMPRGDGGGAVSVYGGGETGDKAGNNWDIMVPLNSSTLGAPAARAGGGEIMGGVGAQAALKREVTPVLSTLTALDAGPEESSGNGLRGYMETKINIPRESITGATQRETLFVWTPNQSSDIHSSTVPICVGVPVHALDDTSGEGTLVKIGIERDSKAQAAARREKEEIIGIIKRLIKLAVERMPSKTQEALQSRLEAGWGVTESQTPIIDSLEWQSVTNMLDAHAVGISIRESSTDPEHAESKEMRKEVYFHGGKAHHFQIVAPPYGGNTVRSNCERGDAALLVQKKFTENAFVANTVYETGYVQKLLASVGEGEVGVKFHTTHMLWACENMDMIFPIYLNHVQESRARGTTERGLADMNGEDTKRKLDEIAVDTSLETAADVINRVIPVLTAYADSRSSLWRFSFTLDGALQYNIPALFYRTIVTEYAKVLAKHQTLNGGSELVVKAHALPTPGSSKTLSQETNRSAFLKGNIRACYPATIYCYLPSHDAASGRE